jgi:hypothetical protein
MAVAVYPIHYTIVMGIEIGVRSQLTLIHCRAARLGGHFLSERAKKMGSLAGG